MYQSPSRSIIAVNSLCTANLVMPNTTITSGLLMITRPSRSRNVFAILHAFEANLLHRFIRTRGCSRQIWTMRGHTEHAASGGYDLIAGMSRARMEHFYVWHLVRFIESVDHLSRGERAGISARSHDDAYRGLARPLQHLGGERAFGDGFARSDEVAFEPEEHGLRLRVPEAAVELEHHRTTRGHHQPDVKHAFVHHAFGPHSVHYRTSDVMDDPLAHGRVEQRISGICAHAAGVRASVAVAHALVIARGNKRHDGFPVGHHQERELLALQTLLDHDLCAGISYQLAREHLAGDAGRFFFGLRDDDPFAGRKPIGFDDDRSPKQGKSLLHFGRAAADGIVRAGYVHALHEFFGEGFAGFQVRGLLRWSEDGETASFELIDYAER